VIVFSDCGGEEWPPVLSTYFADPVEACSS